MSRIPVLLIIFSAPLMFGQGGKKQPTSPSVPTATVIRNTAPPAVAEGGTSKEFLEYSAAIREETRMHLDYLEKRALFTLACVSILLAVFGFLGLKNFKGTLSRIEQAATAKVKSLVDQRSKGFETLVNQRIDQIEKTTVAYQQLLLRNSVRLELAGSGASPGELIANPVAPDTKSTDT